MAPYLDPKQNNESSHTARENEMVSLDIIVPIYNEEEVLDILFQRLSEVFSDSAREKHKVKAVRYIFIDDGSKDRSAEIIRDYIYNGVPAVLYRFSRNFGHQNAVSAGLTHSDADVTAIIDADLQDPPEVIFEMLDKWRQGYDVVYGERSDRKENIIKRFSYWLFYRLLSFLAEIDIPLDSGDFSLLDKKIVMELNEFQEKLRFPRVLRSWVGYRQTGISYERNARAAGKSKYSFVRLYRLATDGLASASIRPLKVTQFISAIYLLFTIAMSLIFFYEIIFGYGSDELSLKFYLAYLFIILTGFLNSLCFYVLSAYIGRTYLEVKGRPSYIIMEKITKS